MKGLAEHTEKIFRQVSEMESIKEYTLIGGTALSLQIGHRLSEDLDFCKWKPGRNERSEVAWPAISKELALIGEIQSMDISDFNQCDFVMNGVKLSFYANNLSVQPPSLISVPFLNNIKLADIKSIGAMKLEVMLRRSTFRDYYDVYCILKSGVNFSDMVQDALKYSGHKLKSKDLLAMLADGERFSVNANFSCLNPVYDVDHKEIEEYMKNEIKLYNLNRQTDKDNNASMSI